ncbi:MAG: substrate-binding domain-containing protein [Kiritimatiellia bacterium]
MRPPTDQYLSPKRVLLAIPTSGADGRARISGINRWLSEGHDWDTVIIRTREDFTVKAVTDEMSHGLDGAIIGMPYNLDVGQLIIQTDLPLAIMTTALTERTLANRPKTVFALIDNRELGRTAATYFRSLGRFAAYAYVHDARHSSWSEERLAGFMSIHPDCQIFIGERESDNTIDRLKNEQLAAFLSDLPHPTALLAANDIIAEQVLAACRAQGLRVPNDISVMGIDNDTVTCTAARPALSSLEPNFNEAGYRAAMMLDALMHGRQLRRWTKQPGVLRTVERDSTQRIAPASRLVRDALDFIEVNACLGIKPSDVINNLRVSRSLANLRFRELTGKSIGQVLTERRLAECERLLRTTDWKFIRIAESVGYANPDILRNLFRSRHGIGPTRWRAKERRGDALPT